MLLIAVTVFILWTHAAMAKGLFYVPDSDDTVLNSEKMVFAHYVWPHPISLDNKACPNDYYNVNYVAYAGEGGVHKFSGGFQRVRPLCVPPGNPRTWVVDNLKREIRQAIARGINGFEFNIFSPSDWSPKGGPGGSPGALLNMLNAAAQVDRRFKILLMPDMSGNTPAGLPALLTQPVPGTPYTIATHPNVYHFPDANNYVQLAVLFPEYNNYAFTAAQYQEMLDTMASNGTPVAWTPIFSSLYCPVRGVNKNCNFTPYSSLPTASIGQWTTGMPDQYDWASADVANITAAGGGTPINWTGPVTWFGAVCPTMWHVGDAIPPPAPNNPIKEPRNSLAYRRGWEGVVARSARLGAVMIVTWNDQVESSMIAPAQTPDGESLRGFYDLTGYYAQWLRHGAAPTIANDAIFYFHRKMPTKAATTLPATRFHVIDPSNNIEMLAFLTSDATLRIEIGGHAYTRAGKAGLNSFTTPIEPGVPKFSILRNGVNVLELTSDTQIYGPEGLPQIDVPGLKPGIFPAGNVDLTYYSGDTVSQD